MSFFPPSFRFIYFASCRFFIPKPPSKRSGKKVTRDEQGGPHGWPARRGHSAWFSVLRRFSLLSAARARRRWAARTFTKGRSSSQVPVGVRVGPLLLLWMLRLAENHRREGPPASGRACTGRGRHRPLSLPCHPPPSPTRPQKMPWGEMLKYRRNVLS